MHDSGKSVTDFVPDDIPTVCAIAVIAVAITTFAHEVLGHASACLLLGGRITQLTSVYFRCSVHSGFVAPAGPAGNFFAALVALAAQRWIPYHAPRARLLALLVMSLSLFWEAGYILASMITARGDSFETARYLLGNPQWPWRALGIIVGLGIYVVAARLLGICIRVFTTDAGRVSLLLGTSWLTAWIAACLAAALYAPDRGGAFTQAAGEIGAAFPLIYPFNRIRATYDGASAIQRSYVWIGLAIVVFAVFAATLGRGLP